MNKVNITGNISKEEISETERNALEVLTKLNVENVFLEISFVETDKIKKLNKEYRKTDRETDVLSFPQPQIKGVEPRVLGSLAISKEIVLKKGETISDNIKHGILHLLAFDHETNEEKWNKEAKHIDCKL